MSGLAEEGAVPAPRDPGPSGRSCRTAVGVSDGLVVVTVTGCVDRGGAVRLRTELLDLVSVCVGVLVVDLVACTYLGAEGAQVLRYVRRQSQQDQNRCRVRIEAEDPDIRAALDATPVRPVRRAGARPRPVTAPPLAQGSGTRSALAR